VEFFDFLDGVEEDDNLRFGFLLLEQLLEDGRDYILACFLRRLDDFVIMFNSFKRHIHRLTDI
jgi:hypothetical protein